MTKILEMMNRIVWGVPALSLILGVGLFLTVRTGFAQFRLFPQAMGEFWSRLRDRRKRQDGVSPMQALCTALAATVGTGNIAGVAGAIAIGGPGSVFWMWCCALLGMVIKYAEATLAVHYRVKNAGGEYVGGPMYVISRGLGKRWNWCARLYCFFGVVAAFGVGNATQVNAVVGGINQVVIGFGGRETRLGNCLMGAGLGLLVILMLLGGAKRIGVIAERLVPFASCAYLLFGTILLCLRFQEIPNAFLSILKGAFSPAAVTGGVVGSAFQTLRIGVSRGVFTNEAGMGTAGIAHGSACVDHPAEQGLMGMVEVFLDTIVICTMTALVILCSGVPVPYGQDVGAALTGQAFSSIYGGFSTFFLALALCSFAFATILGWGLYGARCAQFLLGNDVWTFFAVMQGVIVLLGAVMKTGTVWLLADLFNGCMAIPNLTALAALSPELRRLTKDYIKIKGR